MFQEEVLPLGFYFRGSFRSVSKVSGNFRVVSGSSSGILAGSRGVSKALREYSNGMWGFPLQS